MKKLFEKFTVKSYVLIATFVLTLVAFILACVSNGVHGYAIEKFGLVVLFTIIAFAFVLGSIYFHANDKKLIAGILGLVTVALLVVSAIIVIASRAELVGTLWVTALDSVNPLANRAMNTGFPAFVFYVVAAVSLAVSGFIKD